MGGEDWGLLRKMKVTSKISDFAGGIVKAEEKEK